MELLPIISFILILSLVSFDYDSLYRLKTIDNGGDYYDESGVLNLDIIDYDYDAVGNRLTRDVVGLNTEDIVESDNYVYGDNNRLDSTDDCIYDYDAVGNMISKICDGEGTTYDYDANNMITGIRMPDGDEFKVLLFKYDALGRRVFKQVRTTDDQVATTYVYGLGNSPLMDISCDFDGDLDGNGLVDLTDTILFSSCYQGDYDPFCDLYSDGVFDLSDIVVYVHNLGSTSTGCVTGVNYRAEVCRDVCLSVGEVRELFGSACNCGKPVDINVQEDFTPEIQEIPSLE